MAKWFWSHWIRQPGCTQDTNATSLSTGERCMSELGYLILDHKSLDFMNVYTPQKSNIDTKNCHFFKGAPFSKPSFWVSIFFDILCLSVWSIIWPNTSCQERGSKKVCPEALLDLVGAEVRNFIFFPLGDRGKIWKNGGRCRCGDVMMWCVCLRCFFL